MIPEIILTEMDSIGKIGLINPFATILLSYDMLRPFCLAKKSHGDGVMGTVLSDSFSQFMETIRTSSNQIPGLSKV